jgi:hypothetical protein
MKMYSVQQNLNLCNQHGVTTELQHEPLHPPDDRQLKCQEASGINSTTTTTGSHNYQGCNNIVHTVDPIIDWDI